MSGKEIIRIAKINALIDVAYVMAQKRLDAHRKAGGQEYELRPGVGQHRARNNKKANYKHFFLVQFYHEEMDRLTRQAGLRNLGGNIYKGGDCYHDGHI